VSGIAVIVNPLAGGARAGRLWQKLQPRAERLAPVDARVPESAPAVVS